MRTFLIGLFTVLLIGLAALIIAASLERGVFEAGRGLWPDPWFRATLADAYIGFVIFYIWVAYKERSARSCIVWFVLIMGLGNMAAAFYVLLQLGKLQPETDGKNYCCVRYLEYVFGDGRPEEIAGEIRLHGEN